MRATRSVNSERILLALIGLVFWTPILLTAIGNNRKHLAWPLNHPWIGNHTLVGITKAAPRVPFSWRALARTGEFQKSKADRFNENFGGREALIRFTNEAWFRLFREPASFGSTVAVGANDSLFEKVYLQEYFLRRTQKKDLAPWVTKLRRLQDFCRKRGMAFVVVLSPSKASLYPEDTPLIWRRWYDPRPRGAVYLRELFREKGIAFVDAFPLLSAEKAANPQLAPFFPRGAIHWNSRSAWLVANAVQTRFREQGKSLAPLEILESTNSNSPEDDDRDLVRLLNLARDWSYPVEKLRIKSNPKPQNEQLTMAFVGSSFSWELARQLGASGQFSALDVYFHYRLYKSSVANGVPTQVRVPSVPIDFDSEIFAADCLLLEINEVAAASTEHHLSAFVDDALAHLPNPSLPRKPFRFEAPPAN